jgi:hypothetical protein
MKKKAQPPTGDSSTKPALPGPKSSSQPAKPSAQDGKGNSAEKSSAAPPADQSSPASEKPGKGPGKGKKGKGKGKGPPLGCLRLAGSGECAFGDDCYYKHDAESIAKAKKYLETRPERAVADGPSSSASPAKPKGGAVGIRMAMVCPPSCLPSSSSPKRNLRVTFSNRVNFKKIHPRGLHRPYTQAFIEISKPARPAAAPAMAASPVTALSEAEQEDETFVIERCCDSGAATSLGSRQAWEAQGIPPALLDRVVTRSSSPVRFATGCGVRPADMATTVKSDISGAQQSYQMPAGCPLVFSQGYPILEQGRVFVWHPSLFGGKPWYADPHDIDIQISSGADIKVASKVEDYVPYFEEELTLKAGLVAAPATNDDNWALSEQEYQDYWDFCQETAEETPKGNSEAPKRARLRSRSRSAEKKRKISPSIPTVNQSANLETTNPAEEIVGETAPDCPDCGRQLDPCREYLCSFCSPCFQSPADACPVFQARQPIFDEDTTKRTPSASRIELGQRIAQSQMESNTNLNPHQTRFDCHPSACEPGYTTEVLGLHVLAALQQIPDSLWKNQSRANVRPEGQTFSHQISLGHFSCMAKASNALLFDMAFDDPHQTDQLVLEKVS